MSMHFDNTVIYIVRLNSIDQTPVKTFDSLNDGSSLDISDIPSGLYVLTCKDRSGKIHSFKFVK